MRSLLLAHLVVGCVLVLVGCGPIVMIPGGSLSGETKAVPSDWSFSDEVDTVQLETRPEDPYSVNVWGVGVKDRFYIAAGDPASEWARNMAEDPEVRLRIDGSIYELRATLVENEAEIQVVLAALQRKYDFEPEPEQRETAAVFRLEPRG